MGEDGLYDQGLEMFSHAFWYSIRHLHVVGIAIGVLFELWARTIRPLRFRVLSMFSFSATIPGEIF
jgi:hypothetical protein